MRPHASLYRTHILIALVLMLLAASSLLLAQVSPAPQVSPKPTPEKLAREFGDKFGKLTPTELRVVEAAASGDIAWGDEEVDLPEDSTDADIEAAYKKQNYPTKATEGVWRKNRRVRAKLIRWLCEDEEARKLVDQHGIYIVGAWIDGAVDLSYLHINFPVILQKCSIPNGIKVTSAEMSDLDLVGSRIGEDLTGAPGQEKALNGEELTVHGNVLLSDGFEAFRQVDLYGAKIEGQLYCTDGHFSDPGGSPLRLRLATIGGETALNGGFRSDGVVDLVDAKVNGDLLFGGADFSADSRNGLKARSLTAHALQWTKVGKSEQTDLDLLNAKVDIFEDDKQSWPTPGHLHIDGFVYGTHGMAADAATRLEWLSLQPPPRLPQPYKQLAKVFVDNGQDLDATDVLVAKEADMRQLAEVSEPVWQKHLLTIQNLLLAFIRKVVRGTLWLTIDYGYQPLRALWWIAAFVAIGTYTFHRGYQMGLVIPSDHEAYETFKNHDNDPPAGYQPFNSFVYSLENFVPLIELHQAGYWLPYPENSQQHDSKGSGRVLRWYLWLHILLGWIFTSILVAGMAGLIRNGG